MFNLFKSGRTVREALGDLRRRLGILTDEETRLAYLNEAVDQIDLEMRMRDLDRASNGAGSYQDRISWR